MNAYYGKYAVTDSDLLGDFKAYFEGSESFQNRIAQYDNSADYWKVILGDDGKVTQVLDDGVNDIITYVNQDGKVLKIDRTKPESLSGQIADGASEFQAGVADDKQKKDDINQVMIDSELWYEKGKGWYATNSFRNRLWFRLLIQFMKQSRMEIITRFRISF